MFSDLNMSWCTNCFIPKTPPISSSGTKVTCRVRLSVCPLRLSSRIAAKYIQPMAFVSWVPRAYIRPFSSILAANGGCDHWSGYAGTTSMCEFSIIEGNVGFSPIQVNTTIGVFSSNKRYTLNIRSSDFACRSKNSTHGSTNEMRTIHLNRF